ncbi:hypothetical protein COOONC_11671 [Cooperia oncophora]
MNSTVNVLRMRMICHGSMARMMDELSHSHRAAISGYEALDHRRLLKMRLSDGQNVVHAIEFGGKLALDENALPGTKILLTARVLLRRGILLLNPANCQNIVTRCVQCGLHHSPAIRVTIQSRVPPEIPAALPLFVETEGGKTANAGKNAANLPTISPFLVRIPRIPNQLLQNPETDAQKNNVTVKKEIYDVERTAVVPPLQSMHPATVFPNTNDEESDPLDNIPRCSVAPAMHKLLLPVRNSGTRSISPSKDLPIPSGNLKLIRHEPPAKQSRTTSNDDVVKRPISNYFPVSRQKDSRSPSKISAQRRANSVHPTDVEPLSKQRLVVVMNENDEVVSTEFRESYRREVPEGERSEESCHASKDAPIAERARQFATIRTLRNHTSDRVTTQQMLNPPERDGTPMQDPDFITFLEKSISEDAAVDELRSPPRSRCPVEPPSTAIVPYKRMRSDVPPRNEVSVIPWPMSKPPRAQKSIMEKFTELKVARLGEALAQRKFWMLPKRVNVMVNLLFLLNT